MVHILKKSFDLIKTKDTYLNQALSSLTHEQKSYFYSISSDEQEMMRSHVRAIAAFVEDLHDLYSSSGGVSELHNIDIAIKNTYESLVHFARLSISTLDFLNQKISDDLNLTFEEKIKKLTV